LFTPLSLQQIAAQFVRNHPIYVFVGGVEEKLVANKSITQVVMVVSQHEKMSQLLALMRSKPPGTKAIIFAGTKRMCDQLAYTIGREFNAASIHGDKKQQERDYALNSFKQGRTPVLVATDVAARGLDVKDVMMVINYGEWLRRVFCWCCRRAPMWCRWAACMHVLGVLA
jgi:ATP-dependent RNA helicase DDX5/DBP2